ncbi:MAG: hypothetical protein K0R68_1835, partial [Mycobacterium sp.]|nr:hypothetical protein [Mycobacterium sp.]
GTLDSRTPALWISNGAGRDGGARRDAPKVGWCWAGNRHTWLGFASVAGRREAQSVSAIDIRWRVMVSTSATSTRCAVLVLSR